MTVKPLNKAMVAVFGQGPCTNQQHAVAGSQVVGEGVAVKFQRVGVLGSLQGDSARRAVHTALDQRARLQSLQQILQAGGIGVEFQQQLQRAAAGQAEAVSLVGTDAIAHQLRRAVRNAQVLVQ